MKITKRTKISELIKHDIRSIDAIASIAKPFKKLKNPLLRKLMASRVNIAEAAKIGGATVAEFVQVLAPLGFEFDEADFTSSIEQESEPNWFTNLKEADVTHFDVREILAQGSDPLKAIMQQFKGIEIGKTLCIVNTFVPTPLVKLFEKDNTLHHVVTVSNNEYHTYFLKQGKDTSKKKKEAPQKSRIYNEDETTFFENKKRFAEECTREIDVRHLEMPLPMQTILGELAELPSGNVLYVNHKRIPMYLLEEIESENYSIHIYTESETEVKLLIERGN